MGRRKLVTLADLLAALSATPAEVAKEAAPEINTQILQMGKPGGPLRGGNRVKAHVEAVDHEIRIVGVFPDAGLRKSWVRAIKRAVAKVVKKHMQEH